MSVTIFCRSSEMFTSVAPDWGCRWPLFRKQLYFRRTFLQKFTFTLTTAFFNRELSAMSTPPTTLVSNGPKQIATYIGITRAS